MRDAAFYVEHPVFEREISLIVGEGATMKTLGGATKRCLAVAVALSATVCTAAELSVDQSAYCVGVTSQYNATEALNKGCDLRPGNCTEVKEFMREYSETWSDAFQFWSRELALHPEKNSKTAILQQAQGETDAKWVQDATYALVRDCNDEIACVGNRMTRRPGYFAILTLVGRCRTLDDRVSIIRGDEK